MGMSSYVMDCEEQFINSVSLRIGACEHVSELVNSQLKIIALLILHTCPLQSN